MTEFERRLLESMSTRPGRVGFPMTVYTDALKAADRLIREGYVIERRLGSYPGFQITPKGREYLGGAQC